MLDLVELNEAFASQSLAVVRELGLDPERVNVNGGAIALGHPLGMSGARLVVSLLHELRRRDGRYGLATLCVGVGQGVGRVVRADARLGRLEDALVPRAEPDVLAAPEAGVVEVGPRHQRDDLRPARVVELDLRIAAQQGDPYDHRLDCPVGRLGRELEVVRPHEDVSERLRVTDEGHDELGAGSS
jgi:hypothetical protein